MKVKWLAVLCTLIPMCLPAASRADGKELAGARIASSFPTAIAHRVGGNSANLTMTTTAGPFVTEPSTGLLLWIGFGLISGASLIGLKMARSGSVEDVEDNRETASVSSPARSLYGSHTPAIMQMSRKSRSVTAPMKPPVRIPQLGQLSNNT